MDWYKLMDGVYDIHLDGIGRNIEQYTVI
jgi:hypothetical protein